MESDQSQRVTLLAILMVVATLVVTTRLAWLQLFRGAELDAEATAVLQARDSVIPERGFIYDTNGNILAAPGHDFEFGVDLPLLRDAQGQRVPLDRFVLDMVNILGVSYDKLMPRVDHGGVYANVWPRISPEQAEQVRAKGYRGITLSPIPRRLYPQGDLMCHMLGFVDFDGQGGAGVEGYWDAELAGEAASREYINVPVNPREGLNARQGMDLVLTIDRTVQATVERHLKNAIRDYSADGGSIIVMNPESGAIIAMANAPCFSPHEYFSVTDENVLPNPAVSSQYEPGSVMKLVTIAAGIDSGAVAPGTTYADIGVLDRGGIIVRNASGGIYGTIDMTQTLLWSVNTATSWVAGLMGADQYYDYMQNFGFGRPTGVDLAHEINGFVPEPGMEGWTEATLATNAFGQSIGVTPLQMLSAVSALANDGRQMRPYIVSEIWQNGELVSALEPRAQSVPISSETAQILTTMAVQSGHYAAIDGYTVAGKTGTAQIPVIPEDGGAPFYHPTDTIASFVGWLPADAPEIAMIVKLDVPKKSEWGSETAAPAFATLAEELVVLLDIPPDSIRLSSR